MMLLVALVLLLVTRGADGAPLKINLTSCTNSDWKANCCHLVELMHKDGAQPSYIELDQYLQENPLPQRARLRRAAHLQVAENRTYLEQLNLAYQLWRNLPQDDPRSMSQQNHLHCVWGGTDVSSQLGFPLITYTIHVNWLFFPFHRWFTFFVERILAKLVGDDDFALPFWNWDNQTPGEPYNPNELPHFYRDPDLYPGLYSSVRDQRHLPSRPSCITDLFYPDRPIQDDPDVIRHDNNVLLHHYIVEMTKNGSSPNSFLSNPRRLGEEMLPGRQTFEATSHANVHSWVSDPDRNYEDMGMAYSAVLDPLFFAHHTNVDRIWEAWLALGEGRKNYDDPDFLDAEFFFYNENAQLVRVTVADCLRVDRLMYIYQPVENPWTSDEWSGKFQDVLDKNIALASATDSTAGASTTPRPLASV